MRKIKLFLCVALFGAIGYGAFSAYDYYTMSEEERFLLENIEALAYDETSSDNVSFGCTGSSSNLYCFYRCGNCRMLYQSPNHGTTRTSLSGNCSCGVAASTENEAK